MLDQGNDNVSRKKVAPQQLMDLVHLHDGRFLSCDEHSWYEVLDKKALAACAPGVVVGVVS